MALGLSRAVCRGRRSGYPRLSRVGPVEDSSFLFLLLSPREQGSDQESKDEEDQEEKKTIDLGVPEQESQGDALTVLNSSDDENEDSDHRQN